MAEGMKIYSALLFVWLICTGNALDWQGTGNMSQDNLTVIRNYITTHFNKSKTNDQISRTETSYLNNFTESLSNQLNSQWAPAWNVFVIYINDGTNSDSVFYGYAFRSHWMWYNGLKMNDGNYVSFIIWKDYNCNNTWVTYNELGDDHIFNTFVYAQKDALDNLKDFSASSVYLNEIWNVAKFYAQSIEKDVNFQNSAFTVIASQSFNAQYIGRFCAVAYYAAFGVDSNYDGHALLMRMR